MHIYVSDICCIRHYSVPTIRHDKIRNERIKKKKNLISLNEFCRFRCLMCTRVNVFVCEFTYFIQKSEIPAYSLRAANEWNTASKIEETKKKSKKPKIKTCVYRKTQHVVSSATSIAYASPLLKTVLLFCRDDFPSRSHSLTLHTIAHYMCLVVSAPHRFAVHTIHQNCNLTRTHCSRTVFIIIFSFLYSLFCSLRVRINHLLLTASKHFKSAEKIASIFVDRTGKLLQNITDDALCPTVKRVCDCFQAINWI